MGLQEKQYMVMGAGVVAAMGAWYYMSARLVRPHLLHRYYH